MMGSSIGKGAFALLWAFALSLAAPPASAQAPAGQPPPPVTVAKPVVKEVIEQDDYVGRFDAVDFVEVRARVSGALEKVAFKDGALVKKGDLLFVIDQRTYKAAVDQANAAVVSAQSRQTFAQSDLERAQSLNRTGNITEQVLEQRRQTYLTARSDVDAANAALTNARLNLEFSEIRAPVAGRVSRRLISEGNLVTATTTLLTTIVSLDPIYFYFDVDERSFLNYQRTMDVGAAGFQKNGAVPVVVALTDEKEPTRKGVLDFVDNRIDQATGTLRVRAAIENKDFFISPGMFGTIRVPASKAHRGVLVPDEAIGTDQDRRVVWVVGEDGTASQRTVRPGPQIDGYRVIRDGLKGDETIVIVGLQRIRPGVKLATQVTELPPTRSPPTRS